jgi:hypothetical protein
MRDGVYSFIVRSDDKVIKGIALVQDSLIRGFSWNGIFIIGRSVKPATTDWRVHATRYGEQMQGPRIRGFPAVFKGQEEENGFRYARASNGESVEISITGTWFHELP